MVDGKKVRITEYKNLIKSKQVGGHSNGTPGLSSSNPTSVITNASAGSNVTTPTSATTPSFIPWKTFDPTQNGSATNGKFLFFSHVQSRLGLSQSAEVTQFNASLAQAALLADLANHHHNQFHRNTQLLQTSE